MGATSSPLPLHGRRRQPDRTALRPLLAAPRPSRREVNPWVDGTSDRQEVLVSGLTTSQIDERGGDHTTNGIRMGLDGWIYIAVGDYGFHRAKGKDGTTLSQRGGGILRVRPDGTELEVFAIGLRNPFAIAIDPSMNLFTRDNTNDGA